jgi:hypothetical protein
MSKETNPLLMRAPALTLIPGTSSLSDNVCCNHARNIAARMGNGE